MRFTFAAALLAALASPAVAQSDAPLPDPNDPRDPDTIGAGADGDGVALVVGIGKRRGISLRQCRRSRDKRGERDENLDHAAPNWLVEAQFLTAIKHFRNGGENISRSAR